MASSKLILRAEEVAMRDAGAKAATLTREARAKILANMFIDAQRINCDFECQWSGLFTIQNLCRVQ